MIRVKRLGADVFENTSGYPSKERMKKGIVAVIECEQEIPCNPCELACPRGAIEVGTPITNLPALKEEDCIGCGICVPKCPGQAIFMLDLTYSESRALVGIPYEFLPYPEKGMKVSVKNRDGEITGSGLIHSVITSKDADRTALVYIETDKELGEEVRGFELQK